MLKSTEKILLERQDEELVKLIQEGNQEALECLYIRYKGLIYEASFQYLIENNIAQMYLDDLIDVATECLFIAIKQFTVGEDGSFLNTWWMITNRHQTKFLKKTIESRVSYYDPLIIENVGTSQLSDSHIDISRGVDISIIDRINKYAELFTLDERCFLEYYILGYKPLEIAEFFTWGKSKLYRVKKKAMLKLNKIIKSN